MFVCNSIFYFYDLLSAQDSKNLGLQFPPSSCQSIIVRSNRMEISLEHYHAIHFRFQYCSNLYFWQASPPDCEDTAVVIIPCIKSATDHAANFICNAIPITFILSEHNCVVNQWLSHLGVSLIHSEIIHGSCFNSRQSIARIINPTFNLLIQSCSSNPLSPRAKQSQWPHFICRFALYLIF